VDQTQLKQQAADFAVQFVESGTVVGLGHGSTALLAVRGIAQRLRAGGLTGILGVPCSVAIETEAQKLGIPLTTLDDHPVVDLTIDGADEVAPSLDVIKGGGGAFLREKMVAQATRREIIIVDESKLSPALGTRSPVPVEVVRFGLRAQVAYLEDLGARVAVRRTTDGAPYQTDQGNLILDCSFDPIADPAELARRLESRAGIVEHGLFLGLAAEVVVAGVKGIQHLKRSEGAP
jgi:ribose 5-phosphate isomerase A